MNSEKPNLWEKNTKKKRQVRKQHSLKQKTVEPMNHTNLLFSKRLDLRSLNKHNALQNVSIYYIWRNIRQQYKNKLKKVAPTWNDEFELPGGSYSVSDI